MARKKSQDLQKEISLKAEVMLINERRDHLVNKLDQLKTWNLIERVKEALNKVEAAQSAGDDKALNTAVKHLGQLINLGASQDKIWQEIYALIDRKVQLVEIEVNRQLAEQNRKFEESIPELMATFNEVLDLYIPDPESRKAIQEKLVELFGVFKGSWDNPHEA